VSHRRSARRGSTGGVLRAGDPASGLLIIPRPTELGPHRWGRLRSRLGIASVLIALFAGHGVALAAGCPCGPAPSPGHSEGGFAPLPAFPPGSVGPTEPALESHYSDILLAGSLSSPSDAISEARALARAGKLTQALAIYTRILSANPEALDVATERGRVLGWLGRYHDALADFDRVLMARPRDVEARVGRARVLGWMTRHADAEAEFRRALADDPRSSEAHTGLADVLSWQGRYAEAAHAYHQAHSLAPHDPQPLLGLGRLRYRQNDLAGATAAWEEALRLDPGNSEARERLARAAAILVPRRFRLDVGYRFDALGSGNSDWHQEWARVAFRPWKATTLFVGVDQYRRFDEDDTQLTVGAIQHLYADLTLSGAFTYGVDAEVVARRIYEVELSQPVTRWIIPSLRYRRSNFPADVSVDLVSPGLELTWAPYVSLLGRYYYARVSNAGDGHAGSIRITLFPEGRLTAYTGAGYGRETFLAGTVTQVVAGDTVTSASAGIIWRITDGRGVRVDYEYEDRRRSFTKHGVGTAVFFEF
jgi:YaiO family outer membrane protein